jgi:alpha-glucosidase
MCRWNRDDPKGEWGTPEGVWEIVGKMKEAGVPLETVWSDLDYMDKVRNWDSNEKWR